MTFEKVLEVFKNYLNEDNVFEMVNTKRGYTVMIWEEKEEQQLTHNRRSLTEDEIADIQSRCKQLCELCKE